MPRPVALANGVFHPNIRVPSDLVAKLRGAPVVLPIDGREVTVKIGDKVIASLHIEDPREAKLRFQCAEGRLDALLAAMRAASRTLGYKDVVALSGAGHALRRGRRAVLLCR